MEGTSVKYCVNLMQETPMIHFQYEEKGVCLRPSEVKPRLDSFIIEQLGGWDKIPKEWQIDDVHPALRYKMSITADPSGSEVPHKLYFGNMGLKEKEREAVWLKNISFRVICNCKEAVREQKLVKKELKLMEIIQVYLPYFFALHTFGRRNSKGFGSFSVKGQTVDFDKLKSFCPLKQYYYIDYTESLSSNKKEVFDDIWVIYNMMKSGFNFDRKFKGDYYKGRIFRYYSNKHIGSDKVFIKRNILPIPLPNRDDHEPYATFYFTRAMLGLAEKYDFKSSPTSSRSGSVLLEHKNEVDNKEHKIQRFQSPIRFKLHDKRLLMIPQIIPEKMFQAEFTFFCKDNRRSAAIKTPPKSGEGAFELTAFLDWFTKEFNGQKEIKEFKNPIIVQTIIKNLEILKAGELNEQ